MTATRKLRIWRRYSPESALTVFRGDCVRLLKRIADQSVQLIVTSPPYNIRKAYERHTRQSLEEYLELQRCVISEAVRVLKPGGSVCWQVGNHVNGGGQVVPLDICLHPLFAAHSDLRLRNRIVWHFEHGLHCRQRFSGRHETILWYTKGDSYSFDLDAVRVPQKYPGKRSYKGPRYGHYSGNPLGKNPGDVWVIPNVKGNHVEKTIHPCQFPVEIPERFILALSKAGDLVVDPFLGSGTTAVAAVTHGRRFAGAESVVEYADLAEDRLHRLNAGKLRIRPYGLPVYVPQPGTPLTLSPFNNSNTRVSAGA